MVARSLLLAVSFLSGNICQWIGSRQSLLKQLCLFNFFFVFQITGASTRPFQLTVEKLEKALQDARAEVSLAELHITSYVYNILEMSHPRCGLKIKAFSKPNTWLSGCPYRSSEMMACELRGTSKENPSVLCLPCFGHSTKG